MIQKANGRHWKGEQQEITCVTRKRICMLGENDKNATLRGICEYVVQEIDWSSFCELRINS